MVAKIYEDFYKAFVDYLGEENPDIDLTFTSGKDNGVGVDTYYIDDDSEYCYEFVKVEDLDTFLEYCLFNCYNNEKVINDWLGILDKCETEYLDKDGKLDLDKLLDDFCGDEELALNYLGYKIVWKGEIQGKRYLLISEPKWE